MRRLLTLYILALTIAVLVAGALARPADAQTPTTRLYRMFSWGEDLEAQYGVPIGAIHHWAWDELNPQQGVYNWATVDAALGDELGALRPGL